METNTAHPRKRPTSQFLERAVKVGERLAECAGGFGEGSDVQASEHTARLLTGR
jgi:hypothetical protein